MAEAAPRERAPRWLADEMVGRLARYLRFLGHDTEYARGLSDEEIVRRSSQEGRRVVTRDRALAARLPDALLLSGPGIAEQLRAVRDAIRPYPMVPRFNRCTACNGQLRVLDEEWPERVPAGVRESLLRETKPLFECVDCRHLYWEGTHTKGVRANLAAWLQGPPP